MPTPRQRSQPCGTLTSGRMPGVRGPPAARSEASTDGPYGDSRQRGSRQHGRAVRFRTARGSRRGLGARASWTGWGRSPTGATGSARRCGAGDKLVTEAAIAARCLECLLMFHSLRLLDHAHKPAPKPVDTSMQLARAF